MTFEEAIVVSVRKYYQGKMPEKLMETKEGELKYTREYFDELEEELLNPKKKTKEDEEDLEDELD
tara:strand:- start:474 stop:668 length:195 start_codon:yes stop_codon:yes gene_type:complete